MGKQKPVHECVAEHVEAAQLSKADIAERTGWSEQRVWRLLTGRTELSAEDMRVFARLVKKPVADLYRGVEPHLERRS